MPDILLLREVEIMRDDLPGGVLVTAVAAPVLTECCGGGGLLLAGFVGTIGGWLTGIVVAEPCCFTPTLVVPL